MLWNIKPYISDKQQLTKLTLVWAYSLISYWYFLKDYPNNTFYRTNLDFIFKSLSIPAYYQHSNTLRGVDSIKSRFKTLSRLEYQGFRDKSFDYLGDTHPNLIKPSLQMYRLFLTVATQNVKPYSRIHPSTRHYFLDQKFQNSTVFNPTKLFRRWQDFYHLLFNLFFYKIDLLYFGNRAFKKQILALNWLSGDRIRNVWSFAQPYLFQRTNTLDSEAGWVFQYLRSLNFNVAFVFDGVFHHMTLHYLHRWGFYTIGSVPITHDLQSIHFALPVASEALVMHLFCLRFVSHMRRFSENSQFNNYRSYWALR